MISHLDHEHLTYGKHPMINQEKNYLALKVDLAGASFDNIQVFGVAKNPQYQKNKQLIDKQSNMFPIK